MVETRSSSVLDHWLTQLVCPLDHAPLTRAADGTRQCTCCTFTAPLVTVNDRQVYDFRALNCPQTVQLEFCIPVQPLDRYEVVRTMFRAPAEATKRPPVNVAIKTKLDPGSQHYLRTLYEQHGPNLRILDLGCGSGDNRKFLNAIGFTNVIGVDWSAKGADILVDAHRLPFAAGTFDVVVSTAVFEHLYNPFLAMHNIARVSKPRAWFVGGASFWEAWHGSSYFHFTPDGWQTLLNQNGYQLEDLWTGWGVIPAALAHVFTPGYFRKLGYGLQRLVEGVFRLWGGEAGVRKLQLRASGAYIVFAARTQSNGVT